MVAVPDSCGVDPGSARTDVTSTHVGPLIVPRPIRTDAARATVLRVALTPPTSRTVNGCWLVPSTVSVPVKLSTIVGATGVGAAGVEVLHDTVSSATPRASQRRFFIVCVPGPALIRFGCDLSEG